MIHRSPLKVWLGVILAFALVVTIAAMTLRANQLQQQAEDQLTLDLRVSTAKERVVTLIGDAESGQRGFLITDDDSYLIPYTQGSTQIGEALTELAVLANSVGGREQIDRVAAMSDLVRTRLEGLKVTIALAKTGNKAAAIAMVKTNAGKTLHDEIRATATEMRTVSSGVTTALRQDAAKAAAFSTTVTVWGLGGVLLMIITLALLLTSYLKYRDKLEFVTRSAEARWRTVLASINDGVIVTDADGQVALMNSVAHQLTGQPPWIDGAKRPFVAEVFQPRDPETGAPLGGHLFPQLGLGVSIGSAALARVPIVGTIGDQRTVEFLISPILGGNQQRLGMVLVFRDVAHRLSIDRERETILNSERAARAESDRTSRGKDEFVATLSHELRTPLNAILGWTQILRRPGTDAPTIAEGLEIIERNTLVQNRLIADLLDMSRILSGKLRLDVQSVDLPAVCLESIATVQPTASARNIKLESVIDPTARPVMGDPARLQQIIWNLLSNAIKFTPKGGRVKVSLARVNSHIELAVTDNGEGMSPELLPHIFERFKQADSSSTRSHGGLGLGLSIVKQLTELHGGTVTATSAGKGLGSRFLVSLPAAVVRDIRHDAGAVHPTSESVPGPLADDSSPLSELSLRGMVILAVDDEPDTRSLLKRVLEDRGAEVVLADSAASALEALPGTRPNVIISDLGMPGMDGLSFIKAVRLFSDRTLAATPAIALTAFARSEDRTRCLRAGFQAHVAKPVDVTELCASVGSLARLHLSLLSDTPLPTP